jgi:hypothetical protein
MPISSLTAGAARTPSTQQVPYLRRTVSYNTAGIDSTGVVWLGTLPPNAVVTSCFVKVLTPFNATVTNVLTLGDGTTADSVFAAGDVNETVAATTVVGAAIGYRGSATVDTPLFVKYTQSGTAATAGSAIILLTFIPDLPSN